MKTENQISQFDADFLNEFLFKLKESYEGKVSDLEIHNLLLDYKNRWLSSQSNSEKGGEISAQIIAISLSSLEWWEQNPNAKGNQKVAGWILADAAGAAVSAVIAGSGQYVVTGRINWGTVGWSAVGGAVSGSTGAVGRIVSWLKK